MNVKAQRLSMQTRPSSNVKHPLRWSVESAAREFDWHVDTLKKKLVQAEQIPTEGTYGTRQIVAAIFGDVASERLRKVKEEADNVALRNAILRGEVLPKDLVTQAMSSVFVVISQLIQASSMTTVEKKDLANTISDWPVQVRNVEQKASKQIHLEGKSETSGGNGEES